MPRRPTSLVMTASLLVGATISATPPAQAQLTVIDPASIAQEIRQVSLELQQLQQLQAQLAAQSAMLKKLGTDVSGPLTTITRQATGLMQQADGLGYTSQSIAQQFQSTYGSSLAGASLSQTLSALATWRQNANLTLQQALSTQNQIVQSQTQTTGAVSTAVAASQNAAGQTAAIQATNQLLVAMTTQLTQLQNLLITQARAQQLAAAQAQAVQAAGAADSQRFWTPPQPSPRVKLGDSL